MTPKTGALLLAGVAALLLATPAFSKDEKSPKKGAPQVDFAKQVKPLLEKTCVKCHGAAKQKGDYRLDTREGAMTPGEEASEAGKKPISPGKSAESLIVLFAGARGPDKSKGIMPMPPLKERVRLTPAEVAVISKWIDEGATWPDGVTLTGK